MLQCHKPSSLILYLNSSIQYKQGFTRPQTLRTKTDSLPLDFEGHKLSCFETSESKIFEAEFSIIN